MQKAQRNCPLASDDAVKEYIMCPALPVLTRESTEAAQGLLGRTVVIPSLICTAHHHILQQHTQLGRCLSVNPLPLRCLTQHMFTFGDTQTIESSCICGVTLLSTALPASQWHKTSKRRLGLLVAQSSFRSLALCDL